jgi:hypothetical protein
MDRWVAIVLFLGGVYISLDLPLGLSSNHQLWKLPLIRNFIYPVGLLVVVFWGLRCVNFGSPQSWRIGWWLSILWHFCWIAWLVTSLLGLVVMMQAMPILLVWLFVGLGGSVLALLENRWRISEEKDSAGPS